LYKRTLNPLWIKAKDALKHNILHNSIFYSLSRICVLYVVGFHTSILVVNYLRILILVNCYLLRVLLYTRDNTIWYKMERPNCNNNFHPQMWNFPVGLNKDNKQVYVYYQICPSCKDAIIGIKVPTEGQFICYPNDTGDLILHINKFQWMLSTSYF
jgi:hypothetical protein